MANTVPREWFQSPGVFCHGLRIGFRATQPEVLAKIPTIFPPGWESYGDAVFDLEYSLEIDSKRLKYIAYLQENDTIVASGLDELLNSLRLHLHHTIAEHASEHVFVHAGVVAWQGRIILVPGRSRTGKSTLVRELIRAGAVYFSDEFAVLDDDGLVHPFARPVSLRCGNSRIQYDPCEHGKPVGAQPLPVGLIVITEYVPQSKWNPEYVSAGRALLNLAQNTVSIRSNPAKILRILKAVASSSLAVNSPREEASEIVLNLLNLSTTLDSSVAV